MSYNRSQFGFAFARFPSVHFLNMWKNIWKISVRTKFQTPKNMTKGN